MSASTKADKAQEIAVKHLGHDDNCPLVSDDPSPCTCDGEPLASEIRAAIAEARAEERHRNRAALTEVARRLRERAGPTTVINALELAGELERQLARGEGKPDAAE